MSDTIVAASLIKSKVESLEKSVNSFNESSDRLAKVMIIVMIAQIIVAVANIIVVLVINV